MQQEEPKLQAAWEKYQNYLRMLAEVQLGQWLNARIGASDILQESMLCATRDLKNFRGKSDAEMFGWLKTIVLNSVNQAIDFHVSAQKRSIRREVSLDRLRSMQHSSMVLEQALVSHVSSASDQVEQQDKLVAVADAMAQLKPEQRQVILLRTIEGKPYSEIAVLMERSQAGCRMLWLRAIQELKQRFSEQELL